MSYQQKPWLGRTLRWYLRKVLPLPVYLRHFGRHDNLSLRVWEILASLVPGKFSILDVGAFDGEYSLIARKVNSLSEIFAFEPNPTTLEILRPICKDKQFTLVESAVSNENKQVSFRCDSRASSISGDASEGDMIKVDAITLDAWAEENKVSPSLIKIDVESAAGLVLQGARTLLNTERPTILCEILNNQIGRVAMESVPKDYKLYHINENWGLEAKLSIERYDWRYLNWLFIPDENESTICSLKSNKIRIKEI